MLTSSRRKFLVLDPYGDLLFNEDSQDNLFHSRNACVAAIKDDLDEEVAEILNSQYTNIKVTKREDDEINEEDYLIFQQVV